MTSYYRLAILFLLVASSPVLMVLTQSPSVAEVAKPQIDQLINDACDSRVVLLGEDLNHGSGKTIEVKSLLVQRLIDECGFDGVVFESQIYDFLALGEDFANHIATREKLADAIGGLWSTTAELDPLIDILMQRALDGKVHLMGMDPQLGGATQLYSQERLAERLGLASTLPATQSASCGYDIRRLTDWSFDDESPNDEDFRKRLKHCLEDIQAHVPSSDDGNEVERTAVMTRNFLVYLEMREQFQLGEQLRASEVRDESMYENLAWFRRQQHDRDKTIVWTATTHAIRKGDSPSSFKSLGHWIDDAWGSETFVVGFSAVGGEYGRQRRSPTSLSAMPEDAIESIAFNSGSGDLVYLNKSSLSSIGSVSGRAIDFSRPSIRNWGQLLDGMLIFRTERRPNYIRPARPQQQRVSS